MNASLQSVDHPLHGKYRDGETLGAEITELCSYIYAATYQLLLKIREFDENEYWGGRRSLPRPTCKPSQFRQRQPIATRLLSTLPWKHRAGHCASGTRDAGSRGVRIRDSSMGITSDTGPTVAKRWTRTLRWGTCFRTTNGHTNHECHG